MLEMGMLEIVVVSLFGLVKKHLLGEIRKRELTSVSSR